MNYVIVAIAVVAGAALAVAFAVHLYRAHKLSRSEVNVVSSCLESEQLEAVFVEAGGRDAVAVVDQVRGVHLMQQKHLEWSLGLRCWRPEMTGGMSPLEAVVFSERVFPKSPVAGEGLRFDLLRIVLPTKVLDRADEIALTKRRFIAGVKRLDPDAVITIRPEYLEFK